MFPISSDGVVEDPSIFLEQDKFLEDLLADYPILEGNANDNAEKKEKKRAKNVSSTSQVKENNEGGSETKKTAHKFTERQRRQEMAALYSSLRSLLPLKYIKGKRAISDHMHQAVKYVNDMKKKMSEMQKRREELRKLCNLGSTCVDPYTNDGDSPHCVKINPIGGGIEILISSSINNSNFPLSKVLADLLHAHFNVTNCVSTTGAACYLHKIHIELNCSTSIDLPELQERLHNLIRFA